MDPALVSLFAIAAAAALTIGGYAVRSARHRRTLRALPVRIHVGGTRGKSTTTRLIAQGLRGSGITTLAKTTGTEPRLIGVDGVETPWPRVGPASIAEQIRFLHRAERAGARAVVLECMAVRAAFTRASERLIVRATIAVITNARPDHLEEGDPAEALSELVPEHGIVVVAAEAVTPALAARARARAARLEIVDCDGLAPAAVNRALAAHVCALAGADGAVLAGAAEDPGAFFEKEITIGGKRLRFANAFACNDTVSLDLLMAGRVPADAPLVMLLNHRNDRPLRSLAFLGYLAQLPTRPRLVVASSTAWLRRAARRSGLDVTLLPAGTHGLLDAIAAVVPDGACVWGVGNYHGAGAALVRAVRAL